MSFKYANSMSWVESEVTLGHRNENMSGRSRFNTFLSTRFLLHKKEYPIKHKNPI
jgi:hypothetical protein